MTDNAPCDGCGRWQGHRDGCPVKAREPMFPILGDPIIKALPWAMLAPHETQAKANHGGQTLNRLADRGGLGIEEAYCVLTGTPGDRRFVWKCEVRRALMVMADKFEKTRRPAPSTEGGEQ